MSMMKIRLLLFVLSISVISTAQTRIYSVIGSSTAAGMGTTVPDSSWVTRLNYYYTHTGITLELHNLAVSGHNCYHGMPSWYTPPAGRDYPLVNENVTKALSFNPEVVLVNYPSNNFNSYSISEILYCLQTIKDAVNASGKTCYITTSQPRMDASFPDLASRTKLKMIRDSIMQRFGNYAIDFFTDLADPVTYQILPIYSFGDGIHCNDRGHALLFEKVKAKNIFGVSSPPPPAGCNNVVASAVSGGINVIGLTAPLVAVQIFNNSWTSVYSQTFTNSPGNITVSTLPQGTYHVTVGFYTTSWSPICNKSQDVLVQSTPPPSPPPSETPNCNFITMTPISGGVAFSGLIAPIVSVQIFNNNWVSTYSQSYNNSPGTLSINSLAPGTYHVKVTFSTAIYGYICEKMQDVLVQAGPPPPPPPPPGGTPNCTNITFTPIASGVKLTGLVAPIVSVQVYNNNWVSLYNQSFSNSPDILILTSLVAGTYHVKATFLTSAYGFICEKMQDVTVNSGGMANNSGYASATETRSGSTVMGMRVMSNPFVGSIRLEINSIRNEPGNLIIMDALGKKLFGKAVRVQTGKNSFVLDASRFVPGTYFISLLSTHNIETIKIIKQ